MTKLTLNQKKEFAKTLFVQHELSQKEIALKVGVSEKTVSKWKTDDKWESVKTSLIMSRENELNFIYAQIRELNTHISKKKEGERFANSKEADALKKLTSAAKDLETEKSIRQTVDVFINFTKWLTRVDFEASKEFGGHLDNYIKSLM